MMWVEKNVMLATVTRLNCSSEETKAKRQERFVIVADYLFHHATLRLNEFLCALLY